MLFEMRTADCDGDERVQKQLTTNGVCRRCCGSSGACRWCWRRRERRMIEIAPQLMRIKAFSTGSCLGQTTMCSEVTMPTAMNQRSDHVVTIVWPQHIGQRVRSCAG
eukprot:3677257-Rhodomonas_salina.1